jgi:muramidase (phage lysozyme)
LENGGFAAPLGCAVAAARYTLNTTYEEAAERYVLVAPNSRMEPRADLASVYRSLSQRYSELESHGV